MGIIFNRQSETEKRKLLRKNTTKAESLLWQEIKGRKILGYKFRRQYSVGCYVIDFHCPKLKLAIEIDGLTHLTKEEINYDKFRQSEIEMIGIEFLRFNNQEVYGDLSSVVEMIKRKVEKLSLKSKDPLQPPPC